MADINKRSWLKFVSAIPILGSFIGRAAFSNEPVEAFEDNTERLAAEYLDKALKNFPFKILEVDGKNALEEWHKQKELGIHLPIIVGDKENLIRILEQFSPDMFSNGEFIDFQNKSSTPEQIIKDANMVNFPVDLKKWEGSYAPEELAAPVGKWPIEIMNFPEGPSVNIDILSGEFIDRTFLVLLPKMKSWEVPAYLNWGNWNACPPAKYHVAALKKWNDLYGAELVSLSGDMLEVNIKERPKNRADALVLANELYFYCPDLIDQGFETKTNLAAALLNSNWWSFWWD